MHTLMTFKNGLKDIPSSAAWYLSDISEFKGRQELYKQQTPQKLKVLREHALVESAISSNKMEGVEIERKRINTILFGHPFLTDRNEEEIRGYRDALEWIHHKNTSIIINELNVKNLHKMSRGKIWDAGKYKEKDGDIIERLPSGDTRLRFKTLSSAKTPQMMKEMQPLYAECLKNNKVHPLLLIAAYNLDFLCIHPFRDGNGRVSRLLLLLQLYQTGYEVGKYISLERFIERHKERYYETLEISSQNWRQSQHDPWPYIIFFLYIVKNMYMELNKKMDVIKLPKGEKTKIILENIRGFDSGFSLSQLMDKSPNVSRDMIRKVLKDLKKSGKVYAVGRGVSAKWYKRDTTL